MTDNDVTTVRLPHTGMRVPDRSLTVTGYKELKTSDGVAYTAKLRVDNRIVGLIEQGGHGGPTLFQAGDWRTYGERELAAYAAACRFETGSPVDMENLLDFLVEEFDCAKRVAAAAVKGKMVLRLLDADGVADLGWPPQTVSEWSCRKPRSEAHWGEMSRQIVVKAGKPEAAQWWQGWDGQQWRDVTARPKDVDPNICH